MFKYHGFRWCARSNSASDTVSEAYCLFLLPLNLCLRKCCSFPDLLLNSVRNSSQSYCLRIFLPPKSSLSLEILSPTYPPEIPPRLLNSVSATAARISGASSQYTFSLLLRWKIMLRNCSSRSINIFWKMAAANKREKKHIVLKMLKIRTWKVNKLICATFIRASVRLCVVKVTTFVRASVYLCVVQATCVRKI